MLLGPVAAAAWCCCRRSGAEAVADAAAVAAAMLLLLVLVPMLCTGSPLLVTARATAGLTPPALAASALGATAARGNELDLRECSGPSAPHCLSRLLVQRLFVGCLLSALPSLLLFSKDCVSLPS